MPNYLDTSTKFQASRNHWNVEKFGHGDTAGEKSREYSKLKKAFRPIENPYKLGEKGSHTRKLGVLQDFDVLKAKHSSTNLFVDTEFPANETSIDTNNDLGASKGTYRWLRPKDIVKSPKFFVNGSARSDVNQRALDDCWFLASLAEVAERSDLLSRVVPQCQAYFNDCDQDTNSVVPLETDCRVFDEENYAGIFHFRFWQFGSWVDVVIDDLLPTRNGKLIYARSSSKDEFWCALVQKAYAKLHGCYAALNFSKSSQALRDLTGGICCVRTFDKPDFNLENVLTEAQNKNALITLSSLTDKMKCDENSAKCSIVRKHVHSLIQFFPMEKEKWLKLRNPLGHGEWSGPGSDKWMKECADKELKKRLGFEFGVDGEFFMPLKYAKTHFWRVFICYVNFDPSKVNYITNDTEPWILSRGPEVTAAKGSLGYRVTLGTPSDEDATKYEVIVELTQSTKRTDIMNIPRIGFVVYKLDSYSPRTMVHERKLFKYVTTSSHLELQTGTYRIEPITDEPRKSTKFLLRVFSNGPVTIEDLSTSQIESNEV